MANQRRSFAEYFERWEEQHRRYLERLQAHQSQIKNENENENENDATLLVQQVLRHYQEYYDEKSRAAESDVFVMFSPPWFSSYECTLLWITGFKPSVAFRLLKHSAGADLNEEQRERISAIREETRRMEREIAQAMASVQESVAAPTFCGLVKREGSLVDGEVSDMEHAVEDVKVAMVGIMRNADDLRQRTALQVLEVLSPHQKVKFLAGTSMFWLRSRTLGMERDKGRDPHPPFHYPNTNIHPHIN